MSTKTVKRFSSWKDVPKRLKPGDYIIRGRYIRVYSEVDKETLMRDMRKKLPPGDYI